MARRRFHPPACSPEPGYDSAPLPCLAVTIEEACEVLRLGRCTVIKLIAQGKLQVKRVERRVIIPIKAIEAFLDLGT